MLRSLIVLMVTLASPLLSSLETMSLEEKVGQVFLGFIYGEEVNDASRQFLQRSKLGNVIYYQWANGLTSRDQVRKLSDGIKTVVVENSGILPLIAVDQEGGRVCRLTSGFTPIPSAASLGELGDPEKVFRLGASLAQELIAVGINMNLAPVVDVNVNPDNPVIGSRSYGADPELVCQMAGRLMASHRQSGVATVLKHFPGHGDTNVNSHYGLPSVNKSLTQLQAVELMPFRCLAPEADAIMTGHLLVPALDPQYPATFSSLMLNDLLREQWGFRGIIISDSLNMRAIVPSQPSFEETAAGIGEAAIRAFLAGCDCLIVGRVEWADFSSTPQQDLDLLEKVMAVFCQAVRDGVISEERLNTSVGRILTLKHQMAGFFL